jgi:Family of unknown function (DUF6879)
VQVLKGKAGFAFLDDREMSLRSLWFHYSTPEVFAGQFRSPDWLAWRAGNIDEAVHLMRAAPRKRHREEVWKAAGVHVARVQVVDAPSLADPAGAMQYFLTYLAATHPHEDRLIVDAARAAAAGVDLPELDFLIHDDDVAFTKYEGEPGVIYRRVYWNRPPAPGQDDDRAAYAEFAAAARLLLESRETIAYLGPLAADQLLTPS